MSPLLEVMRAQRWLRTLATVAVLVAGMLPAARAQTPIKFVVPFAPGGTLDAMARMLAQQWTETYQEPAVVENRPGASGIIGTRYVMQAPPDGRTLLMSVSAFVTAVFTDHAGYDPRRDFTPVIFLTDSDNFLVANPGVAAYTVADLVKLARQKPQGLTCGGPGGQMRLGCEQLRLMLDGRVLTVPYQGLAPATQALIAGEVDFMFVPRTSAVPLAQDKRLRILASAGARPPDAPLQNLPLVKDTLPGVTMDSVIGVHAPARTPDAVVRKLNARFNELLKSPASVALLADQGYRIVGGPPDLLARKTAEQYDYYERLVEKVGAAANAR